MVTLTAIGVPRFRLPTREDWRYHMANTKVLVTGIICVTFLLSLFVGGVVYLAATGHSAEALTTVIVAPLVGALVTFAGRLKTLEQTVRDSPNITTPE